MPASHPAPKAKPPTDAERMLRLLQSAGPRGVHSHDLRRGGITGNPAQRATDLEARGHSILRTREHMGKRPGTRYTLLDPALDAPSVEPQQASPNLAEVQPEDERLFGTTPTSSPYDPANA